jgi:uncharacterized membrane protein YcaP (DUF421 family)
MEPEKIAVRALFTFIFLLAIIRSSGKRTVHEGTTFDFVFALILGDLVDDALWAEVPAANFVVATGMLALIKISAQVLETKSRVASRLFLGMPTLVIRDGAPVHSALIRLQMPVSELEALTRLQGVEREMWSKIGKAWLESSGELSIQRTPDADHAQKGDLRRS